MSTDRPAPERTRRPVVGRTPAEDAAAISWVDRNTGHTPVPAHVFYDTVQRLEGEVSALRDALEVAHRDLSDTRDELRRAREELGEVLSLLRAQSEQRTRMWDHIGTICKAFADDGKVRVIFAAGAVLLILVLAGVSMVEYRDGALTIGAPPAAPAPLP